MAHATRAAGADAVAAPADIGHLRHGPSLAGWVVRGAVVAAVLLFVVRFPNTEDRATDWSRFAIYAIVGLSLNILIGYTGQLSLGHQAFLGIGAFGAAYSATERGVPFFGSILIATAVGALFALLLGVIALRITGLYLALITLIFGLTMEQSLFQVAWLTQGGAGQPATRPEWLLSFYRFYLLCLAFLAFTVYVDWRLTRSKTGRALLALRENERVAAAFGINVTAFKLLAFVLSGAFAGLAGALFAYRSGVANGSDFDFFLALTFVLMTVVGGLNSRVGVIVGSFIFAMLEPFLHVGAVHDRLVHGVGPVPGFGEAGVQFAPAFIGAVALLFTLIFNPGGIAQQLSPLTRWLSGHRFSLHADHESGPGTVEGSSVRA